MKLARRKFLHLAAGAATLPALSRVARAQTYPSRPSWSCPSRRGGASDVIGRILAQRMKASRRCLERFDVELPGVGEDGMPGRNGQRKPVWSSDP
jgi:tripartite-type tricarboxylate transporter receptor subunit TctC